MNNVIDGRMTVNSSYFGCSVSFAGDKMSGYSDIIVGADGFCTYTGRAEYLFWRSCHQWVQFNNVGSIAVGYLEVQFSDAGDVNNDGYDDIVIGAPEYDEN